MYFSFLENVQFVLAIIYKVYKERAHARAVS